MHTFQGSEFTGTDRDGLFTPRQLECLVWAAEGKENTAIATLINRSPAAAKKHVELAMSKLQAGTRTLAVARAFARGYISAQMLIVWLCITGTILAVAQDKEVLRPRTKTGRELREGRAGGKRRQDDIPAILIIQGVTA
jgi:DNA-binding CsgD family transcriptional regulator